MSRVRTVQSSQSRAVLIFVLFLLGVGLTVALYYVKTRAQTARDDMLALKHELAEEQAAIRVLEAEIAYLETPERLEGLAGETLGLAPTPVKRFLTVEQIAETFPLREEEAVAAMEAQP